MDVLDIDGSQGEGGGQVLRTSLSLSLCLGRPIRIFNVRARRKRPGLARQHLAAVRAAAEVGRAEVRGAELGSQELSFIPEAVRHGDYRFDIGTAGSTTLLLQTVLPALMTAGGPSHLVLEGGTHNPLAPSFDFLAKGFFPLLRRMGPRIGARLERAGFYPRGGGRLHVDAHPCAILHPLELPERGPVREVRVIAAVAGLPRHIAEREARTVADAMGLVQTAVVELPSSWGPGNVVSIEIESEQLTEVFTGFGERGVPAEEVAMGAVAEARRYLAAGVPVGTHLADQLLLPLALAGGGSFRTLRPTGHTLTNKAVIEGFMAVRFRVEERGEDVWEVSVGQL